MKRIVVIIIFVLGVAVIAGGIGSLVVGRSNAADVTNNLKNEKISLAVFDEDAPKDAIISNAAEARQAVNVLIEHRKKIAPTYSDLLGGEKFDPTNTKELTYAQAMNLQNSMTTAVLAYGLTTTLTLIGSMLLVVGIAIVLMGVVLIWPAKTKSSKDDRVVWSQ